MRYEYKTISLRTVKGFKQAEKLKEKGWKVISLGWDTITFEKENKND